MMKSNSTFKINILILAAGSSSRLGQPKQLLQYNGTTMLRRSVEVASETNCPVFVVTGSNHDSDQKELKNLDVEIIYNSTWQRGMGNSLKVGLSYLLEQNTDLNAVIIMVCDQPKLGSNVLAELIKKFQEGNSLVASQYGSTLGVPALFGDDYFSELLEIQDQQGAKVLFNKYSPCPVSFADGIIDIDTKEDYERLSNKDD